VRRRCDRERCVRLPLHRFYDRGCADATRPQLARQQLGEGCCGVSRGSAKARKAVLEASGGARINRRLSFIPAGDMSTSDALGFLATVGGLACSRWAHLRPANPPSRTRLPRAAPLSFGDGLSALCPPREPWRRTPAGQRLRVSSRHRAPVDDPLRPGRRADGSPAARLALRARSQPAIRPASHLPCAALGPADSHSRRTQERGPSTRSPAGRRCSRKTFSSAVGGERPVDGDTAGAEVTEGDEGTGRWNSNKRSLIRRTLELGPPGRSPPTVRTQRRSRVRLAFPSLSCSRQEGCSVRASSEAAGCELCNLPKEART
jgi:hypothetical protein